MRFFHFSVILIVSLLLLSTKTVQAEMVRVTLSADEIYYDYGSKQIEAKGNVQISYKKTKVESDHAIIDHEQNILLATGNVKVVKEDDDFNGDRFLYYLETQQGWVFPVATLITDEELEKPVFLTAKEAFMKGEEILFKKTFLTGCDLEKPHYHFTSSKVEYLPGDIIKLYHTVYWEHTIPLFYFPVFFISLKEDSNDFGVEVGWNEYDGWWILSWYTYYFNADNSLMVRNKTTEHGVDRWELHYNNEISTTRKFTGVFELADNDKIGNPNEDYRAGFRFEDQTHPKLNYETTLDNWRRYTDTGETYIENEYNFTLRGQSPYPFLALDYDVFGMENKKQINIQESWRHNFDSTTSFSLSGRWFYNELSPNAITGEPSQSYTYNSSFDKRWDWSQLSVKAQESRTLGYSSENVIPDITYTIPKWDLPLIEDVKIVTQYTDKERYNGATDQTTEGERLGIDLEKTNNLWAKGSLNLSNKAYYRFREYLVDEVITDMNALTEEMNLTNTFTDELSSTITLGYTEVRGENNTFFNENILPGAEVWNSWNWRSQHLSVNLKTGYNFEIKYAHPVSFDTSWTSDTTRVSLRTEYHWDNGPDYQVGLGQTSLEVSSDPKQNWHLRLMMSYDFWEQIWWSKIMDVQATQQIGDNWKIKLEAIYDMFIDDFSHANASLIYHWHCREFEFHYDWIEQEYWVGMRFDFYPKLQLRNNDNPWEFLNYEY